MFLKFILHLVLIFVAFFFFYELNFNLNKNSLIHLIVTITIIEFYSYKFHKILFDFIDRRIAEKEQIRKERFLIETFLNDKLNYFNSKDLINIIKPIESRHFHNKIQVNYNERLKEKLIQAKRLLETLEYKEEIEKLRREKLIARDELEKIQYQKQQEKLSKEEEKEELLKTLELNNNPVFRKDNLSEKEIESLKENDYNQSNEYSIITKKVEPYLIKKVLNHSNSHTFVIWDILQILKLLNFEKITEHKTVDADITFKYKNKIYAIEVETGNLLKKKKQLEEKVNYLNNKYKNRWLFVVTNRNLVPKYNKFGLCTQRMQFLKILKKWLNLDIQQFWVLKQYLDEN